MQIENYKLTETGLNKINKYIDEIKRRRKEILDANLDTVDETPELPDAETIFEDLINFGFDDDGQAMNCWFITDNTDMEYPICITLETDVIEISEDNNKFIQTDDLQWCRIVSDDEFDLVEVRYFGPSTYGVVAGSIDLNDYSDDDIKNIIAGYGYKDIDQVKSEYGDDYKQIIAECVFEQTSEIELTCFGPYETEDIAEKNATLYIKNQ